MGYYVYQKDSKFLIRKANVEKALAAIKSLDPSKDSVYGSFAWVDPGGYKNAATLEDALYAWRYDGSYDDEGNYTNIRFDGEKEGDCNILFKALAPYVEAGSYIEMYGECGNIWRWVFDGKIMKEKTPKLNWED